MITFSDDRRAVARAEPDACVATDDHDDAIVDSTEPAICIRKLNFFYDEGARPKQVLFDINLDIWPGEVALLTGPSGCGKTTLLSLIGGLRTVQSGELVVLGRRLHTCAVGELPEIRRHIGFIFQMHNLLDFLTARQNIQMALQLHGELSRQEMELRGAHAGSRWAWGAPGFVPRSDVRWTEATGVDWQGTSGPPQADPRRRADIGFGQQGRPRGYRPFGASRP